ncbi:MarR family transcriptional regulator [Sphingomonas crocodyli]|uniref:MarR family transcriptional regulator n=1 Tax=Sphingomonas crocodyli TaxID=1979270 RepID=A0A437LXL8_9SPHN|nr:MarR family transcriptional regulator [Sphingomonas crocodyli]RVT90150.1 MarR family transcriptional regulator [Sphingomonas crocodyli]
MIEIAWQQPSLPDKERCNLALHAFARLMNAEAMAFISNPSGASIVSQLLDAHDAGRNVHVGELTRSSQLSVTATLRRLDQLEKDGFIRRSRDPHDGRSRLVAITAKGRDCALRAAWEIEMAGFGYSD